MTFNCLFAAFHSCQMDEDIRDIKKNVRAQELRDSGKAYSHYG